MVRPKASLENLQISGAFAQAITVRLDTSSTVKYVKVECRGSNSIFAAMRICLPHLIRMRSEPAKKGAVSEIQLNKYLAQIGFKQYRYRRRILGTSDKWSKGCHQWQNLRWIQIDKPEELQQLQARLSEIVAHFPKKSVFQENNLLAFLSSVSSIAGAHENAQLTIAAASACPTEPNIPIDAPLNSAPGRSSHPVLQENPALTQQFQLIRRHLSTRSRSGNDHNQSPPSQPHPPAPRSAPHDPRIDNRQHFQAKPNSRARRAL
jgi:hypothetical protein